MKLRKTVIQCINIGSIIHLNKKECFKFKISKFSEKNQIMHKFSGNPFRKVPTLSCLKQEVGELLLISRNFSHRQ